MNNLANKNAVVTGASSGIGQAAAIALAKEGCNVALLARNQDKLKETAKMCAKENPKGKFPIIPCDLSELKSIPDVTKKIGQEFGNTYKLSKEKHNRTSHDYNFDTGNSFKTGNISGKGSQSTVPDGDIEDWDKTIVLNSMAPIHVTKLLFPMMKDNGWGAIINLVSIAGMEFFKGSAAYCASKHCARAFSNTLFEDIRQHNIKVCTINPGYVNTPLLDDKPELDRSKMIQPDDIAQTILFVCKFPQTGCPTEIVIKPQQTPKQQA